MVERPILLSWLDCHRIATAGLTLCIEAWREEREDMDDKGHAGDQEQDAPASAPRNSTATPAPPVPA